MTLGIDEFKTEEFDRLIGLLRGWPKITIAYCGSKFPDRKPDDYMSQRRLVHFTLFGHFFSVINDGPGAPKGLLELAELLPSDKIRFIGGDLTAEQVIKQLEEWAKKTNPVKMQLVTVIGGDQNNDEVQTT